MSVNEPEARAGGLVTEMFLCEVAHVILHIDHLYVFRVHTYCGRVPEARTVQSGLCASDGGKASPLEQWQEKWRRPW